MEESKRLAHPILDSWPAEQFAGPVPDDRRPDVFDHLSASEIVALSRLAHQYASAGSSEPVGYARYLICTQGGIIGYLGDTLERDLDRAKEIFATFEASPMPEDRRLLTRSLQVSLTCVDHDAGLALWDRLIRDVDAAVRRSAHTCLIELLEDWGYERLAAGSTHVEIAAQVDESFTNSCGLTALDTLQLLESHALAEAGFRLHDLGCTALGKVIALAAGERTSE